MENTVKRLILSLLMALLSGSALAKTQYVTDEFKITMRNGESSSHKIVRMLSSGTSLTVVSENKETGYSMVRTPGGTEGYVLSRYLNDEPIARDRLAAAEEKIRQLEAAPGELRANYTKLSSEHEALQKQHQQLVEEKTRIENELGALKRTSANAVRIANERNQLQQQLGAVTKEHEELKQQTLELENNANQRWFLIGGGVLLGGVFLGLILPHLRRPRRTDSWGSL